MKKLFLFLTLATVLLASCAGVTPTVSVGQVQTAVYQTLAANPTTAVPATNTPANTATSQFTSTPRLTNTPRPTNTITPTFTPSPTMDLTGGMVSKNYLDSQDKGGMVIEIARILIADKAFAEKALDMDFSQQSDFDDKITVVEFVFKITNNTDKIIKVYADQGEGSINNEPINFMDYSFGGARFGDDLGGDFLPGSVSIGGIWVGIKRAKFNEVNNIKILISSPSSTDYHSLGSDYLFEIPVEGWGWEDMPQEID